MPEQRVRRGRKRVEMSEKPDSADTMAVDPPTDEALLFDAELRPHRSLGPRGFLLLMIGVCSISFAAGIGFYLAGAWPVVGFLGADVLLIYMAFRINYRRGRLRETLHLTREKLTVRRIDHHGRALSWQFEPTWLQILSDKGAVDRQPLVLRSHGRSLAIGAFLTAEERSELAEALKQALHKARSAHWQD